MLQSIQRKGIIIAWSFGWYVLFPTVLREVIEDIEGNRSIYPSKKIRNFALVNESLAFPFSVLNV